MAKRIVLAEAIDKEMEYIEQTQSDWNPQVVGLHHHAKGSRDMADAALKALNGDQFYLRNLAGAFRQ